MEVRFVVLHHTGAEEGGGGHFDLMVEVPGERKLMTWRVGVSPEGWGEAEDGDVGAVRIADHRKVYMTYEGEISGGRGEVKRVAEGTAEIVGIVDAQVSMRRMGAGGWTIVVPLGMDG
jgi:hypothetical protein